MVFKICVTIKKKVFTAHAQTKISKNFKMYQKCVCLYHQFVKKNDLFQNNPVEKFSVA